MTASTEQSVRFPGTRPTAFLDTSVIYSWLTCDLFLSVAAIGVFSPFWSSDVEVELHRNLSTRIGVVASDRRIEAMHKSLLLTQVRREEYQSLIPLMTNHPKDRHVLAAAYQARVDTVVTLNTRHFPDESTKPLAITLFTPDRFLSNLLETNPDSILRALQALSTRLRNPPQTIEQIVKKLGNVVPSFSATVESLLDNENF